MKAKLIKVALHDGYRLDDENGLYIASTLESSKSKLSLKNCQAIERGYDLDELARKEILYNDQKREWWKQGAKYILEILGDKKFSEENLLKAFTVGLFSEFEKANYTKEYDEFLKSLQQTEWEVEIEMDTIPADRAPDGWDRFPKLDADGCLILKGISK